MYIHVYVCTYTHMNRKLNTCESVYIYICTRTYTHTYVNTCIYIQPIADRVAKHLEIISKTYPTNQNAAHGIDD